MGVGRLTLTLLDMGEGNKTVERVYQQFIKYNHTIHSQYV